MRQRIEIQSATVTTNSVNEPIESWSTDKTVWGQIETVNPGEKPIGNSLIGSASKTIRIRYYSGLTNKHRVKFGSRYFSIDGIDLKDEIKREMILYCTERSNITTL